MRGQWFEVYDLLDFLLRNPAEGSFLDQQGMVDEANAFLAREASGYRFVAGVLAPISSEAEVKGIADAVEIAEAKGLDAVAEHIRSALQKLREKPEPDYRNATKEAISAVESAAKLISGVHEGGLKDALDALGVYFL